MKQDSNWTNPAAMGIGVAALLGLFAAQPVAQSSDLTATLQVDGNDNQTMEMMFFLGDERMRMDAQDVSVVSISGSDASMMMIQHPQRQYLLFEGQQLQMMQQMMSQFGGGGSGAGGTAVPSADFSSVQFEETGVTTQIGPWTASEVRMTGSDGQEGELWLTEDTDVGLFEIMMRLANAASALSNPMAGGAGPAQQFLQYQALAQTQGLPDGRVVRIVSGDSNQETMVTLTNIEAGTLSAETFAPPAGYQQIQMPSLGGLLGQ